MRKWLFGICCLALATPAWAQGTTVIQDPDFLPVNHIVRGPACCPNVCPQKVCVAIPDTIKHTKVVFSAKCIEYCLPKCSLRGGCDSACTTNCGPVRTKNVLMKRVITEECPGTKCVPGFAAQPAPCATPACPPGHRFLGGHRASSGTVVETVPVAPMPLPKKN